MLNLKVSLSSTNVKVKLMGYLFEACWLISLYTADNFIRKCWSFFYNQSTKPCKKKKKTCFCLLSYDFKIFVHPAFCATIIIVFSCDMFCPVSCHCFLFPFFASIALTTDKTHQELGTGFFPDSNEDLDVNKKSEQRRVFYSPIKKLLSQYMLHKRMPIHKRIPIHKRLQSHARFLIHKKMGDMGMNGFHGDTFSDGFGDFSPSKRNFGGDAFHSDTFSDGFGEFSPSKRTLGGDAFHGDAFTDGLGDFSTSKRNFGGDAFHGGDTFSDGFGDFSTTKKKKFSSNDAFHGGDTFSDGFGDFTPTKRMMGDDAFHSNTFSDGFGEFSPSKRSFGDDAFHRDTFSDGFGGFSSSKRTFGNDAFHGDTFSDGFGDFSTLWKPL